MILFVGCYLLCILPFLHPFRQYRHDGVNFQTKHYRMLKFATKAMSQTSLIDTKSNLSTSKVLIVFNSINVQSLAIVREMTGNLPKNCYVGIDSLVEYDADGFVEKLLLENDITAFYFLFATDRVKYSNSSNNLEKYRQLCKYTLFVNNEEHFNNSSFIQTTKRRFNYLLDMNTNNDRSMNKDSIMQSVGKWSHFLSLTSSDVHEVLSLMPQLRIGVDAFELRVDLLKDTSISSLHRQIALLYEYGNLPIVFTVRTKKQIGNFPDEEYDQIINLLTEGLRAGVEFLDIEASLPSDRIDHITELAKRNYLLTSRLLGSLHITTPQSEEEIEKMFQSCYLGGKADMFKVVTGASSRADCELIHRVGSKQSLPYIGLCLGATGEYSRVLNQRFTPVTHSLLKAAAPGQLTVDQLMTWRQRDQLIVPQQFHLFGFPIQHSLSPAMHNSGFQALHLPHQYSIFESPDVEVYQPIIRAPPVDGKDSGMFRGASVTIPHKEIIMEERFCDEIYEPALTIGAVNTLVIDHDDKLGKRTVRGYNTDWLGMKRPISRLLSRRDAQGQSNKPGMGLVLGAGGTARAACYVVNSLGFRLFITNRSPEKGIALAERFNGTFVLFDEMSNLSRQPYQLELIISTLPNSANVTLPDLLFTMNEESRPPIVLDVVYKPALTSLLSQALSFGCKIIQGSSMLLEQGLEQFELWTLRKAPQDEMRTSIFTGVEKIDST